MLMVEGRKTRQTERELCRLMWAWIVLRRRHERRAKKIAAKAAERKMIEAATPPRKTKAPPTEIKSPTSVIEEMRMSGKERWNSESETRDQTQARKQATRLQMELHRACLKRRKQNLEKWFRSKMTEAHRVRYQRVLNEITKFKRQQWKPTRKIKDKKTKKKRDNSIFERKMTTIKYIYEQRIWAADRAMQEAQEAIEEPTPWLAWWYEEANEAMDVHNNNHYFWHRGRPPEGDY
jgi:hypothetical protein